MTGERKPLLRRIRGHDDPGREVVKTEQGWRESLTPAQFRVLRRRGTEPPFSNEDVTPDADGLYRCAACDAVVFRSETKFESGTGWPSFTESEVDVERHRDFRMGIPRTEVRCRRCGGHLGHVFRDGPASGRLRFCINGCALSSVTRPSSGGGAVPL